LKDRLLATEKQIEMDKASRSAAEARLATLRQKHRDLLDDSVVYSRLLESRDIVTRAKLREEIRKKVARIEIDFYKKHIEGRGTLHFKARVEFANGARRLIAAVGDKIYLSPRGAGEAR
jgi:hypothetical protein